MQGDLYGSAHRTERAKYAPAVSRGEAYCMEPICLLPDRRIPPGTAWDLAHDREHGGYHGPSHATCNRAEGGRWRHRKPQTKRWRL